MRVGVIGGGQLARMMIPPAIALGIDLRVLAETEDSSAAIAATAVGDYRDAATVLAFARDVDVVTFDHEHVPQPVLAALVAAGIAVRPGPAALAVAQDKLAHARAADRPRRARSRLGRGARRRRARRRSSTPTAAPAVVKTPRGGYDGKGVRVVRAADGADDWFAAIDEHATGGRCSSRSSSASAASSRSWWPVARRARSPRGRSSRRCSATGCAPR